MQSDVPNSRESLQHRGIAIAALVHALLVLSWWYAAIWADIDIPFVSGRMWLAVAWAWLCWPIYVLMRRRHLPRLTFGAVAAGAAVLAPAIPTIYTFSAWAIGGFAP